jgi:stage II sporulation protein D
MRHLILLAITLVLLPAAASAAPAPQPVSATMLATPAFVLTGGGYGHGVGMSQYGAFAQAGAGRSYREILTFYYRGAAIGKAPVAKVRVLVASARRSLRIGSTVPFRVRDSRSTAYDLPAGEIVVTPDLKVAVDGVETALAGPLTFRPGKGAPLLLDGRGYRGDLRVAVADGVLQVVDYVALDAYLLGVVPGEVPKEWPAEALKAQAVAARSYALASLVKGKQWDLYADVRSQVYYGVERESPTTTAAVKATRGEVLTHDGKVVTAFYYSSSGGRTAASEDVFGVPVAYLQSVDDPWDDVSPFHRWQPRAFSAAALARAFGLTSAVTDVSAVETASGRPASVVLGLRNGTTVQLRAADVRSRLGLRSTAFRLGVLRFVRPGGPTTPGTPVQLGGLARDVDDPVLEKLDANGTWVRSARLAPAPDGTFTVTVRPRRTSTYRLSAVGLPGPALTLTVVPGTAG